MTKHEDLRGLAGIVPEVYERIREKESIRLLDERIRQRLESFSDDEVMMVLESMFVLLLSSDRWRIKAAIVVQ